MALETRDWLTITGWGVTFGLGLISGGFLVPRLSRKKRIMAWGLLNEADIVSRELSEQLMLPVTIVLGNEEVTSLSLVRFRLGNAGTEVLENVSTRVTAGGSARVRLITIHGKPGEYSKHVHTAYEEDGMSVRLDFINPGVMLDIELAVNGYESGSLHVDLAAPGVTLVRRDGPVWDVGSSVLRRFMFNIAGVSYDPKVAILTELVEEVRSLRKSIGR